MKKRVHRIGSGLSSNAGYIGLSTHAGNSPARAKDTAAIVKNQRLTAGTSHTSVQRGTKLKMARRDE